MRLDLIAEVKAKAHLKMLNYKKVDSTTRVYNCGESA